ncbi:MAG TPA: Bax inhibitor-1 family protein [Candidatus Peribacteraceae bacterium]|nr:Bax inhibitor-1 family protein [Candidatus Peribacteraceae bacterium]
MDNFSSARSQPVVLSSSTEAQTYLLLALALGLSALGTFLGFGFVGYVGTPLLFLALIAELAIIFTSRWWIEARPLNYLLFALFPVLSGFTFAPYIIAILAGYVNGASILLNAILATVMMTLAAAVFARTTSWNLGVMGRALFFAVLGLIGFGILQIFIPALRGTGGEMLISGAGIVVFGIFTAFDIQRVQAMGRLGANPVMLALSLYLDIFNLLLYILRFMLAISGQRR